ncbi:hypothetical protein OOK60_15260 [Trichothermofontia sichuanensis B231]|uniref:hypothetical protein n=1 Tax=Trichothermofontia sichuanensis TaxID=3045816 RepID=UPI0022480C5D|nr:hypothetical protein [Trichothermofontia sichuanensis]UZQ53834.1 hypothetical protein OOK60_15260 [Trichothermofontia sichuanensis B231]
MATPTEVRQYLAHWFQLGKRIFLRNGQEALLPDPVIQGDHYSDAFEECWRRITAPEAGDCYLEGTQQTIQQLLAAEWELLPCARCTLPVPIYSRGVNSVPCPCNDLRGWPNLDLPLPRLPISTRECLQNICQRLEAAAEQAPPTQSTADLPALLSSPALNPVLAPYCDLASAPLPPEESSARSAAGMLYGFTVGPQQPERSRSSIPRMQPEGTAES